MNPQTRKAALYAIAVIAMLASANALAHSYAGLYDWAAHHRLTGWQAMTWPAEIDVFLAVGELALYVAYLDGWHMRQRIWPWVTTLVGLVVSVAGNVGHIQPLPGHPVLLVDRLTAAASPLAAFAGLTVGLLVLRMNRQQGSACLGRGAAENLDPVPARLERANGHRPAGAPWPTGLLGAAGQARTGLVAPNGAADANPPAVHESPLLRDAVDICRTAAARGERLSQRALARALRGHGHRFPNESLRGVALAVGLASPPGPLPATEGRAS